MAVNPRRNNAPQTGEDSGTAKTGFNLIAAVYRDQTEDARNIIDSDPDQINEQDPSAKLTPLHIAIFRQNFEIVEALLAHPNTDLTILDAFGRSIVDMLDYTTNQFIFEAITGAVYGEELRQLADQAYEQGRADNTVVPLKPKDES